MPEEQNDSSVAEQQDNGTPPVESNEPDDARAETEPNIVTRFGRYLTTANSVMVTLYAFILSLVIGAILLLVFDDKVQTAAGYFFARPTDLLLAAWLAISGAYGGLFEGAVVNIEDLLAFLNGAGSMSDVLYPISETLTYAAPLIMAGLAVGLAFRAGLFNIGAEGQVLMGVVGATVVGFSFTLPAIIHIPLVLLAGALAGGAFGAIPGILKARTGVHEVITSIMLNYVALHFLGWVVGLKWAAHEETPNQSKAVAESARLPLIMGGELRSSLSILLAIAAGVVVWWLLSRSTLGFQMRAVGFNQEAARTAGMSVPKAYVVTLASGGALAGIGGAFAVSGMGLPFAMSHSTGSEIGFDGITVALLGRAKPGGIVAAGLLFGAMRAGTSVMQPEVPIDMVVVLQAVIVIFIAAPALVKSLLRLRMPEGGLTTTTAKGW
ncbi:MAG TPA: ABC transporter permease [Candidatus Stackebrandtia faecavium]|nr:ABC transporter permease [Candidatus Stackebrandtia faecavium]